MIRAFLYHRRFKAAQRLVILAKVIADVVSQGWNRDLVNAELMAMGREGLMPPRRRI
jgi:hypothetical protein